MIELTRECKFLIVGLVIVGMVMLSTPRIVTDVVSTIFGTAGDVITSTTGMGSDLIDSMKESE